MSVHQVEEFYIFIKIDSGLMNYLLKNKVESYMQENGIDDFEWQSGDLCIDGFDSESNAECHNRDIRDIIERYSN